MATPCSLPLLIPTVILPPPAFGEFQPLHVRVVDATGAPTGRVVVVGPPAP